MSLFSRIGKLFDKRQEATKSGLLHREKTRLSIGDAIKLIEDQRSEKTRYAIEESYGRVLQIYSEIQALRGLISAFKNIKIEEKKAKASNDVKDRFCAYSEKQLSAIGKPEKDLAGILEFLDKTERTFASLGGLTPKQVMHIGFFFKRDVSEISRKTVIIGDLVLKAKKSMHMLDEYENFYRVRKEIESLEQKASTMESEKRSTHNSLELLGADARKIENDIDGIDMTELSKVEREHAELESTKSMIEQELLSYLSVEKILRKLKHHKNLTDSMLDAYIRSPSAALIEDNGLRIFHFIEQAISLASRLEFDEKSMLKLNRILERKDYIKEKRKELVKLAQDSHLKKKKLNDTKRIIDERRKNLEMSKDSIEARLSNNRKTLERINRELGDIRKNTEVSKNELKAIAGRLTSSELE